jgi:hypothetical protein
LVSSSAVQRCSKEGTSGLNPKKITFLKMDTERLLHKRRRRSWKSSAMQIPIAVSQQIRHLILVRPVDRPSSLPNNWPNPTADDIQEKPNRIIKIGMEQEYHFTSNVVKTSKYELYNFLPKFLLEEFNPVRYTMIFT